MVASQYHFKAFCICPKICHFTQGFAWYSGSALLWLGNLQLDDQLTLTLCIYEKVNRCTGLLGAEFRVEPILSVSSLQALVQVGLCLSGGSCRNAPACIPELLLAFRS